MTSNDLIPAADVVRHRRAGRVDRWFPTRHHVHQDQRTIRGVADANRPSALRVLVYSSDADTRGQVMLALGRDPHPDLPSFEYHEIATAPIVIAHFDAGGIDLAILDGEAAPTGGMGLAKQLKDEITDCPPVLVLTGRADDAWLASWSRADATTAHPLDPFDLVHAVVAALDTRPAT